jgi:hypothetical protein
MTLMISTWFVSDSKNEATKFAQVAGNSSTSKFQAVYWRCIAAFYATSKLHNPAAKHVFFTNTRLPVIDGMDFVSFFEKLGVQTVTLPITFRLQKDVSDTWGNQFYILDIIRFLAANPLADHYLVLDSDCVWTKNANLIEAALIDKSCLLYTLGVGAYDFTQKINGVTRQEMAQLAAQVFPEIPAFNSALGIHYHGGEVFAATQRACVEINADIDRLWPQRIIANSGASGFLEEAHFLSIIYKHRGYEPYSANSFIKRMWTGYNYTNITEKDVHLPIWHLPAEKEMGFKKIFSLIVQDKLPSDLVTLNAELRAAMGIPRKSVSKFVLGVMAKIMRRFRFELIGAYKRKPAAPDAIA